MSIHRVVRPALLSLLLVAGMLSTTISSASAASWLAPQNVPLSVGDLGFDEDGNAIAVGIGASSGGDAIIRAMVRPFGGQWSASVPVSGSGDSEVQRPQLAVNAHGDAVAVWSAYDDAASKEVVRVASRPAGGTWSAPHIISEGAVFSGGQDVAIDAQGNATVIWSEIVGDPDPTWLERAATRPSGGDWSDPVDLSESAVSSQPRLAVDPQGTVTAVWLGTAPHFSGTGTVDVVRSNSRTINGTWSSAGTVALSSEAGTASAEAPQIAVDAQGRATAVWGSFSSGGGYIVQAARRAAGGAWGAASKLGDGSSPKVAVDPLGNATAIWTLSSPSSSTVLSSGRTATGSWTNPAPMASGDDDYDVGYPFVTADPQGNVTAIWARYNLTDVIAQATRHVATSSSWSPAADLTVGRPITAIPAVGTDPQGHTTMVWSSSEDPWSGSSTVFDPIAPTLGSFAITPVKVFVGGTFGMSVNPFDAWSAVTVSWDFGDGQTANGAAVTHAYSSPGQRTVTVTGTDAAGNTAQASQTFTIDPAPVPPPGPGPDPNLPPGPPLPAPKTPVLSGFQQSNTRWLTRKVKRGPRLPVGTTFRFQLDRAAQVRLAFSQIVAGRRVNGRCVKATKSNRKKPRCDRAQAAGTLNVTGKAGANRVPFQGKLGGRTLPAGRYRVLVTARADGKTSTAASAQFTIAR
jgi:hypothetical protein